MTRPLIRWTARRGRDRAQPNVRGSVGCGSGYRLLENSFKREDSVKDIGALLN